MSQGEEVGSELIARLTRAYTAFNRGEFDAAIEELRPTQGFQFGRAGFGSQGSIDGVAAFRQWMEPDAIESQRIEPTEFRIVGDRALVRQLGSGRGAGSGIEVSLEAWAVWTFDENGDLIRLEAFTTDREAEAREAAGLSE